MHLLDLGFSLWVVLAAAALWALLVARYGCFHAFRGPIAAEIRSLTAYLNVAQSDLEREQISERVSLLRSQLNPKQSVAPELINVAILFGAFSTSLLVSSSLIQGLVLCIMLSLLWLVVCTDRASFDVLDVDVFAIALFCGWVTMALPQARWTVPEAGMLGFLLVATVILMVSAYLRLKQAILSQPSHASFGDGDSLLLFALALFFGVDVISIVVFASIYFLISQGVSYLRGKYRSGAAFIPSIFAGTVVTIFLIRKTGMNLNQTALDFIEKMQ